MSKPIKIDMPTKIRELYNSLPGDKIHIKKSKKEKKRDRILKRKSKPVL